MHPVHVPHELVNDESVLLVEWLVADGAQVTSGQPIAVIETSKAATEVEAPQVGYLRQTTVKGTEVAVGAIFCYIAQSLNEEPPSAAPPAVPALAAAETGPAIPKPTPLPIPSRESVRTASSSVTRFSRRALELIGQHGLNHAQFEGKGLVRGADILAALPAGAVVPQSSPVASPEIRPGKPLSDDSSALVPAAGVPVRTQTLSRAKRVEAKYLSSGQQHTLPSVVSVACSAGGLKAALALQPELGGNFSAVLIYEVARLLKKYPILNAYHHQGDVHFYEQVNIGLAVDSGHGLKVPVISKADEKGVIELAREVDELLLNYLNDDLPVTSLAGGTFTITDLSGQDVFMFHPLINRGQAAILGIGAEFCLPGSHLGFLNLILAFDHQLTEGRLAAAFLAELRDRIGTYEMAILSSGKEASHGLTCSRCSRDVRELDRLNLPLLEEVRASGEKALICRSCLIGS